MQFVAPMVSWVLLKVKFSPSKITDPDLKKCIFWNSVFSPLKFVKIRPNKKKKKKQNFTVLTYIFLNKSIM